MVKEIFDEKGERLIRTEEATPICQQDFCDDCGDCLSCYGEDECPGGVHRWVQYGETPPSQ